MCSAILKKHGFPEFLPLPSQFHCSGHLYHDHIRRGVVTLYTVVLYPSQENRKECAQTCILWGLLCTHSTAWSSVKIRLSYYQEDEWRKGLWHVHMVASPVSFIMSINMWKHDSHWEDFHEILYLGLLSKSAKKPLFGCNWTKTSVTVHEWWPNFGDVNLPYHLCKNQYFYIFDSTWFSSVQKMHWGISTAGIVMGTCHNDGYVHCLSCYHMKLTTARSHYICFFQTVCTVLCCWIFESLRYYAD